MKKYLARISIVLWGVAAFLSLMVFATILIERDSNSVSYLFLLVPVVAIISATSFILTGTLNVKKILAMCQE